MVSSTEVNQPTLRPTLLAWLQTKSATTQVLLLGGATLAVGYGATHLPGPLQLLEWAGLAGLGLWSIRRIRAASPSEVSLKSLTAAQVQQAIAKTQLQIERLQAEAQVVQADHSATHYTERLVQIEAGLQRRSLEVQIIGTRAGGKTALYQSLSNLSDNGPSESELQAWHWAKDAEVDLNALGDAASQTAVPQADIVLAVVQGDITQAERQALQHLGRQQQRILLALNKCDQYLPAQVELVLAQIRQSVQDFLAAEDVMAISVCPQPMKVRRHQPDGTFQDTWETPQPQLEPLLQRLNHVATQELNPLVRQRAYREILCLQETIHGDLNQLRRDRALPLIERYQWIAGGTAFANPLPSLDMVATAVITGKLIQELASIYNIPLSLERAGEIAGVLAKALVQMGLAEAITQLLSTVLKGNLLTYAAGGALQGVSAAYLTRVAAFSLIELFEVYRPHEAGWQLDVVALQKIAQRVFSEHQRLDIVKDFVQQTLAKLQIPSSAIAVSNAAAS
ncbi:MAG TPA: DUF697 domain-containing protein [Stenomitos sp.]